MKKLFGPLGAGGGALLLLIANLGSYGAGLVRDLFLANIYGASTQTDAFFAGFLIPDFLFNFLVLGFVAGALLPVFLSAEKQSQKKSEDLFRTFLTIVTFATTLFSVIAFFLAPFLIQYFFSVKSGGEPRSPEEIALILKLTRILLLSPILFGISNTFGMILLAKKRFFSLAISPILYNVGIIIGIAFFGKEFGIEAAAWGAVGGALLHLSSRLVDFPATQLSALPKFKFSPELKQIFLLGLPKTLGLISFQLVIISFSIIASKTEDGGIAAWNFARNLQSLAVSLFGISFATAAFPFLSDFAAGGEKEKFVNRLQKSTAQILFFTLPAAIGLILISNEAVEVLFQHGRFDAEATYMTVIILIGIAFAIPFESLTHLYARAFLAYKNTVIPALGKILFLIVAVSVAADKVPQEGVGAFGIAFGSAVVGEIFFLMTMFHRFVSPLPLRRIWQSFWRPAMLALLTGVIVHNTLLLTTQLHTSIRLGLSIIIGGLFYLLGAFLLRMPEIREIFLWKKKKL